MRLNILKAHGAGVLYYQFLGGTNISLMQVIGWPKKFYTHFNFIDSGNKLAM